MGQGTGIANGFLSIICVLASVSYIITTLSYYWATSTMQKSQTTGTQEFIGLWKTKKCMNNGFNNQEQSNCQYVNPYESRSISARPSWDLFAIFMMPVACSLSVFATITAIAALPQLKKFSTKPKFLMILTAVFMIIAGLIALTTGIWVCVSTNSNSIKVPSAKKGKMGKQGKNGQLLMFNVGWAAILTLVTGIVQLLASFYAVYKVKERSESVPNEREYRDIPLKQSGMNTGRTDREQVTNRDQDGWT